MPRFGTVQMVLNYGKYHRIWPFVNTNRNELYVSVALPRPSTRPLCKLIRSKDYGRSWTEIADFHTLDKRNTTTGQPFVTREETLLIPVWNAGFYTHGTSWFAIYKSNDSGSSWEKVYENPKGTYGKHFFQGPAGNLYIGVGLDGGGSKGRVSPTPGKSYLLRSRDMGQTWEEILRVDYPTALYSGVALDDITILVAAREKKSLFLSVNGGKTWKEMRMGNSMRSISYIKELDKIVVTSNSALFISDDAESWTRLNAPIKGLMLRYPTWYKRKLYMSSAAWWRSYVVSTDLNKWYLSFDVTRETGSNLGARMAVLGDYMFIGDEANGTLLQAKLSSIDNRTISTLQKLDGNLRYLISGTRYTIRRLLR